jgi:hypothetical protein
MSAKAQPKRRARPAQKRAPPRKEADMPDGSESLHNKWKDRTIDEKTATAMLQTAEAPIGDLPLIKYKWHTGPWRDIFECQINKIRRDIRRAKVEDKLAVYLSCPISSRGGGFASTNVDVARHIERSLLARWGEAFWILNPAQYQLESKAGAGLMDEHADFLGLDIEQLKAFSMPTGGDYMRMWTTVLAENGDWRDFAAEKNPPAENSGQAFDAFYFIGPRDVQSFFIREGANLTTGIQTYFAQKYASDGGFRTAYHAEEDIWEDVGPPSPITKNIYDKRQDWQNARFRFLRYYGLRASANFSLGCHDEWLILKELNERRMQHSRGSNNLDGDVGERIAAYFDGSQVDPASSESAVTRGYCN